MPGANGLLYAEKAWQEIGYNLFQIRAWRLFGDRPSYGVRAMGLNASYFNSQI